MIFAYRQRGSDLHFLVPRARITWELPFNRKQVMGWLKDPSAAAPNDSR
jgi:hypothetical protein